MAAYRTLIDATNVRGLFGADDRNNPLWGLMFQPQWCRMVDYPWAAAWPTDFGFMTGHGQDVLPERLLRDGDVLADLPDKVLRNILRLARTPGWRHTVNLTLWRRIMRTRAARDDVLALLDAVFNPRRGTPQSAGVCSATFCAPDPSRTYVRNCGRLAG
jgi:hypothetical protein